jgi:N-acetyl-gamma-glutamyl-phosphate reductase
MEVTVPVFKSDLKNGFDIEKIKEIYKNKYNSSLVSYCEESEEGFLSAGILSRKDSMIVSVFGNEDRILLVARYDNLGKGASGAAVECLNIVLGSDDTEGLEI